MLRSWNGGNRVATESNTRPVILKRLLRIAQEAASAHGGLRMV